MKNYNSEFKAFPVINTEGNISKTILLLEKYYELGYRFFIGFLNSSTLSNVLDWFNMHPDAVGISPASTAPLLKIPKKYIE